MTAALTAPVGATPLIERGVLSQVQEERAEDAQQGGGRQLQTPEADPVGEAETVQPTGPSPTVISNVVFVDLNANGSRDQGEPGLAGVSVTLFQPDGNGLATALTNANGRYVFGPAVGVVPGTVYTARFDTSTITTALPGGFSNQDLRTPSTQVVTNRSNNTGLGLPFDLSLSTSVNTASVNTAARTVTFNLTVANQGSTVDAFEIVNYFNLGARDQWSNFPAGLNRNGNAGGRSWTWDASNPQQPIVRVNGTLAQGAQMTIPIVMRWNAELPAGTSQLVHFAEIANFGLRGATAASGQIVDRDSTPDRAPNNDGSNEDDRSGAAVELFDLALNMTLDDGADTRAVIPNSRATFTITVENQGILPASNIQITNYLPPPSMTLADPNWTRRVDGTATLELPGTLAPGQRRSVNITFLLGPEVTGQTNIFSEISRATALDSSGAVIGGITDRDSTFDSISNNDRAEEDDHDGASIRIGFFDLAVSTTVAGGFEIGAVPIGNAVVFNIEVINEGEVAATDIVLRDYLPRSGLVLVDPDWTDNRNGTATLNRPIAGPIAPGRSILIPITFMVDASASGTIYNWAEIVSADTDGDPTTRGPVDVDSRPANNPRYNSEPSDAERLARIAEAEERDEPLRLSQEDRAPTERDEDDHDFAGVSIDPPVLDLALQIRVHEDVEQDDLTIESSVPFVITVFNQGSVFARDITIADYLPEVGLTLADSAWRDTGEGYATRRLQDPLAPDSSIDIEVNFVVSTGAVNTINNGVEIIGAVATDFFGTEILDNDGDPLIDIDSLPFGDLPGNEPGAEDDFSVAAVHFEPAPVYDLALWSELKNGSDRAVFAPGDVVEYTLTLLNEGEVAVEDTQLVMRLPEGFELTNRAWDRNDDGTVVLTLSQLIHPTESVTVDVAFRAGPDARGNNDHNIWIGGAALLNGKGQRLSETESVLLADFDVADNTTVVELNAIPTLAFSGAEADTGQLFGWAFLAGATFVALLLATYTRRKPREGGVRLGNAGPAASRWGPVI